MHILRSGRGLDRPLTSGRRQVDHRPRRGGNGEVIRGEEQRTHEHPDSDVCRERPGLTPARLHGGAVARRVVRR